MSEPEMLYRWYAEDIADSFGPCIGAAYLPRAVFDKLGRYTLRLTADTAEYSSKYDAIRDLQQARTASGRGEGE